MYSDAPFQTREYVANRTASEDSTASTDPPVTPQYDIEADDLGFYFRDAQYASRKSPAKGYIAEDDLGVDLEVESPFEVAYGFDFDADLEPDDLGINFASAMPYFDHIQNATLSMGGVFRGSKRPRGLEISLHPPPRSLYGKLFFYSPASEHYPALDDIEEGREEMTTAPRDSIFESEKVEVMEGSVLVGEALQPLKSPPPVMLTPSLLTMPTAGSITTQPTLPAPAAPAGPVVTQLDRSPTPGMTLFNQFFGFCFPAWAPS